RVEAEPDLPVGGLAEARVPGLEDLHPGGALGRDGRDAKCRRPLRGGALEVDLGKEEGCREERQPDQEDSSIHEFAFVFRWPDVRRAAAQMIQSSSSESSSIASSPSPGMKNSSTWAR